MLFYHTEIRRDLFDFDCVEKRNTESDVRTFYFFYDELGEKTLRLCVKVYTELHQAFLILIALKRATTRHFTFFLALFAKNLATLRLYLHIT